MIQKFLIKGSLLLIILFIVDKPIGWTISELVRQLPYDNRIEKLAVGEFDAETIILGSSRALAGMDAGMLQKLSNTSTYNLGFSGSNIDFQKSILSLFLDHNTPKTVILEVVPGAFITNDRVIFRKELLYPYACYPTVFREICSHSDKIFWLGQAFWMYRENNNLIDGLGYLKTGQPPPQNIDKIDAFGSTLTPGRSDKPEAFISGEEVTVYDAHLESDERISNLNYIIELCDSKDIKLVLVVLPVYVKNFEGYSARLKAGFGTKAQIVDLSNLELDKAYFRNWDHLNREGAGIITEKVYTSIEHGL